MFNKKEYNRRYSKMRYDKRMKVIKDLLGGKCIVCNSTEKLETHHKDPKTKLFDISSCHSRPWHEVLAEALKCELRCKKHHVYYHYAKHGTISRYRNHKCRCELCRTVWNEACKKWNKKRKAGIVAR